MRSPCTIQLEKACVQQQTASANKQNLIYIYKKKISSQTFVSRFLKFQQYRITPSLHNRAERLLRWFIPTTYCSDMLWTVVLEKTLESPLDCKEIQPVHSVGDQPWVSFGRNAAKAETPVLWPPHAKSWLIGKDPDPGRDWGQEEKGTTEDKMARWHHRLDGREFRSTPGVGDGQGGLACCDSWGRK